MADNYYDVSKYYDMQFDPNELIDIMDEIDRFESSRCAFGLCSKCPGNVFLDCANGFAAYKIMLLQKELKSSIDVIDKYMYQLDELDAELRQIKAENACLRDSIQRMDQGGN